MTDLIPAATGLLKRPVETACNLLENLFGEPFRVGGDLIADQIQLWQWSNRVRILEKTEAIMEQNVIAQRVLPPRFLLPFLDGCKNADEEELQNAWARLLAVAVETDSSQHVSLMETLRNMQGNDVKVLDAMIHQRAVATKERTALLAQQTGLTEDQVGFSLSNITHLGFFTPTGNRLRGFAKRFLAICIADQQTVDDYVQSQKDIPHKPLID